MHLGNQLDTGYVEKTSTMGSVIERRRANLRYAYLGSLKKRVIRTSTSTDEEEDHPPACS